MPRAGEGPGHCEDPRSAPIAAKNLLGTSGSEGESCGGRADLPRAGKMFAMCNGESHPDPLEACINVLPEAPEALVASDPKRFFVPLYLEHKGWIGVRLHAGINWSVVTDLVHEAFRMTAPRGSLRSSNRTDRKLVGTSPITHCREALHAPDGLSRHGDVPGLRLVARGYYRDAAS